ncbi:hypothetical protein NNJEOMEG_04021 [Fundidesulfovibrio magnetotacticus]|uniref:Uncharacterized protein n=1 Tax=Fundidesulfovibrio magnetotacticus TaxID=2730080 RepID=A0A6V8M029_9BACT|nr:hypothetical protein NNJEOMEG_04021 [Fundidesulfovibrio magnetotacticus]
MKKYDWRSADMMKFFFYVIMYFIAIRQFITCYLHTSS